MAEHLFKFTDEKIDAKKVVKILKPNFAPVGNNRRQAQASFSCLLYFHVCFIFTECYIPRFPKQNFLLRSNTNPFSATLQSNHIGK